MREGQWTYEHRARRARKTVWMGMNQDPMLAVYMSVQIPAQVRQSLCM